MEKKEEMRKGPWTEQEDVQLALYVNLFGDRRWDFIAKVSGLKRTGKSCRLRWVNYLHPGLKRGKMTPHEERLVLELHSKWGNRWSRIARKLPGRTDNEIKNYWRTHMRKKSQDQRKKQKPCISSSSSSSLSNSSSSTISLHNSPSSADHHHRINDHQVSGKNKTDSLEQIEKSTAGAGAANSMDEIWKEFEFQEESCCRPLITCEVVASPIWEYYCPTTDYSLWSMDNIGEDQETKTTTTTLGDHDHDYHSNFPFCNYMSG